MILKKTAPAENPNNPSNESKVGNKKLKRIKYLNF